MVDGTCTSPRNHPSGNMAVGIDESLPNGLCPLAFYSAFPYYLTLVHGGNFVWIKKGNPVKVQCPKADGVEMAIRLVRQGALGDGTVRLEVINIKGPCPRGHKIGDVFDLDSQKQSLPFRTIAALIPFKAMPKGDRSCTSFRAPDSLCYTVE